MPQLIQDVKRALRVKQVAAALDMGVSTVWRLSKQDPEFPRPFHLSPRVTVWAVDDISAYVEAKRNAGTTS